MIAVSFIAFHLRVSMAESVVLQCFQNVSLCFKTNWGPDISSEGPWTLFTVVTWFLRHWFDSFNVICIETLVSMLACMRFVKMTCNSLFSGFIHDGYV